jgi:transposase
LIFTWHIEIHCMEGLNMATGKRARQLAAKAKYWSDHVAAWTDSHLRQAEYCRRHGLKAHNLCYWVKKLGAARTAEFESVEAASTVELVEVDFRGPGEAAPAPFPLPLQVVIGERFKIELRGDFDAAVFEKLALSLALISDRLA